MRALPSNSRKEARPLRANALEKYNINFLFWIPAFAGMTDKVEQIYT